MANRRQQWGDVDTNDEDLEELPKNYETECDANGIKTVVEFVKKEDGSKVKITRKVKVVHHKHRVHKRVLERKAGWRKFGECANAPPGWEANVTFYGEPVRLEISEKKVDQADLPERRDKSIVICRICGMTGDHWTLKCPYKDRKQEIEALGGTAIGSDKSAEAIQSRLGAGSSDARGGGGGGGAAKSGTYVPPALRGGAGHAAREGSRMGGKDDTATVRVTNLSEDTREQDLRDLFQSFGHITRIYLAKDKISGLSKGFAFVNYVHRSDALHAIEKLNGFGYDNLILHVEWAKPSTTREGSAP